MPLSTCRALDRLDRPSLSSQRVHGDLRTWRDVAHRSESELRREHNDGVRFVGPFARSALEQALHALSRRRAAPLRREIARIDAVFRARTLNDPHVDPSSPWWMRRC